MTTEFDLATIAGVASDMDGVLWRGDEPLPGLHRLFRYVRSRDVPIVLATNNASKTPEHYVRRLAGFGVALAADEVLTSSIAAAGSLAARYEPGAVAFTIGGDGLREAMAVRGFDVVAGTERPADVVVVGVDFELTYEKLADAAVHIQRGAKFVATNTDPSYPAERGLLPGAGAIVAAVATCTGVEPEVVGKPGKAMFDMAVRRLDVPRERVVMIGDRLDTDILGARDAGLRSVLVTSGVSSPDAVAASDVIPDFVYSGLDAFVEAWSASVAAS